MKNKRFLFLLLFLFAVPLLWSQNNDPRILIEEQGRRIDFIKTNLDYVWVILGAMLVFFMQAGFMALESGMARSKNSINVAIKNLTDFVLGVIGYWFIGFGLMFGSSWHGFMGVSDFLISIENPWTAAFFMFQSVFVGTAATIDSGAICERAKLKQYVLLSFLLSVIIYPIFGHWAWGSFLHGSDILQGGGAGWLEARGFKDFAGSSVVHSVGGWMALAGVIVVGPRLGKFTKDPETGKIIKANKIPPGDMRFVFLGTFILFFGWYGFNCGSTLAASPDIAVIALNTTLAACFACLTASILSWIFHPEKKIEGEMIANGVLAGLVGITAGCAFVGTVGASIIGAIAGIVVYVATGFLENVLKLDDVVGAIPVHGFCGAWGTLAVGFFILPEHLGDMSRMDQISIQALGVITCFGWAFGLGILFYFLVDRLLGGVRVSEEEEILGLNISEHGAKSSILELANTMDELTKSGDFSGEKRVAVEYGTEIGDLAELFNSMIVKVKAALEESRIQKNRARKMLQESEKQKKEVIRAREDLEQEREDASKLRKEFILQTREKLADLTNGIDGMKDSMHNTADTAETMTETFSSMSESLEVMLDSLTQVYSKVDSVKTIADSTGTSLNHTRISIDDLQNVTGEIESMVDHINDLADRTSILSINSSIEAARAGEAGKGFTVISNEVRELAGETATVTSDITLKLNDMGKKVGGVASAMEKILTIVNEINGLNYDVLSIVDKNQDLSRKVDSESRTTLGMVKDVNSEMRNASRRAEELSSVGNTVREELEGLS